MMGRSLIACGRHAPEATQGALVTESRGGTGGSRPSSLEKARKRRRLALKSRRSAGPAHIRRLVVVRLRGSYAAMTQGARGRLCRCSQPRVLAARSLFPTPPERSGRQTALARDASRVAALLTGTDQAVIDAASLWASRPNHREDRRSSAPARRSMHQHRRPRCMRRSR
jgi:hypothetical protein